MERTLIENIGKMAGKETKIQGRVINLRKLGSITFIVIQDYASTIQTVWSEKIEAKIGDSVEVTGLVKEEKRARGGFEVEGKKLTIVSTSSEDLPFDIAKPELDLQLSTLLDHRTLTLRHPKVQAIFKLYDILLEAYEIEMRKEGFTEVKTPKLLGAASEGGANFFKVQYFEKEAFLAQSPQLYKQIMVGVFERVFEIGTAFRAEPHFTTRHVNEYTSLDAEMGYINSFCDVMAMLNKIIANMFKYIGDKGHEYLKLYNVEMPKVPKEIPKVKLAEIRQIIKDEYNYQIPAGADIDPEGERLAGKYAKEKFDSDFLFITNYFWEDKPFYTMPSQDNTNETEGFDLIFKGIELVTGSQRIHNYEMLIDNMKKKNVSPKGLEFYLDTFKHAMPPHGGWGIGSERLLQNLLDLKSIKEAILFPRDVKRLNP